MKKILTALFALAFMPSAGFCGTTALAAQDFDVSSVASGLKATATSGKIVETPEAKAFSHSYYTRDCASFVMRNSEDLETETVILTTKEMIVEDIPDHNDYPNNHNNNNHNNPNNGGHHPRASVTSETADTKGQVTHVGTVWREPAKLTIIGPRVLLPWENERFTICVQGAHFSLSADNAAYKYSVISQRAGLYTIKPGSKVPTVPAAISAGKVSVVNGRVEFTAADAWAKYYAGETTEITAELYYNRVMWFDKKVDSVTKQFTPDGSYKLELGANLQPGKYYVKWGYKRLGQTSTQEFVQAKNTDKVEVK